MRAALVVGAAALAISLGVSGCGPEGPSKADTGLAVGAVAGGIIGSAAGRGSGRIVGAMVGTVVGGIVGSEIGRSMDKQDRMLAERAEFDAFERGPSGRPVRWQNPDNGRYGDVVPMAPYRRGEYDCRDFTHTIYIDGRPQAMRGTACRNPDGTWRNVT
ncbi:MAG: RT0821/Lpp0805 family surface protein [Hyphomicrobiaceae bacterium]|nr:RT0821/Lpp0805 family surface protein [Hyphomicrobiaceae bacterium]